MKLVTWFVSKRESLPITTTIEHLEDRCRYYRSLRDDLDFDVSIKFNAGVEFSAIIMLEQPSEKNAEDYLGFWDILNGYQKSGFKVEDHS